MTQLPTPELGEMELTWQEIMSITELQVSGGGRVGGGRGGRGREKGETGSLAGSEAGGWSKQSPLEISTEPSLVNISLPLLHIPRPFIHREAYSLYGPDMRGAKLPTESPHPDTDQEAWS